MTYTVKHIIQNPTQKNPQWILEELQAMLSQKDIERSVITMAYISACGAEAIAPQLRALGKKATVFAGCGIGNDVTSKQAIEILIKTGAQVYVFNTKREDCVFHPKTILCIGKETVQVYGGSLNLTRSGLSKNVEYANITTFSRTEQDAMDSIQPLLDIENDLINDTPDNIIDVNTIEDAQDLHEVFHWLIDETCTKRYTQRALAQANKPEQWDTKKLSLTANPALKPQAKRKKSKPIPSYIKPVINTTQISTEDQKSQSDIYEVLMKTLLIAPGGHMTTKQFKETALNYLAPHLTPKDNEILEGTGDKRIKKTIDNVISHRNSGGNPIEEGYVAYNPKNRTLALTDLGRIAMIS